MVTSLDIEVAIAKHFDFRRNLIVPNISWGLGFHHEIDVMVVTPAGYAKEIEIKVTKSDLKRDGLKRHNHPPLGMIKELWFAVPLALREAALEFIPERAGLYVFHDNGRHFGLDCVRPAKLNKSIQPLSESKMRKLYELAAMRTWTLKDKLKDIYKSRSSK